MSIDGLNNAQHLARHLLDRGLTLALAESCTGGLVGHLVTSIPGSSAFFDRGFVVYSNQAKMDLLGVNPATLAAHGAVSSQTAAEMAAGARARSGCDVALAITGIAGPDGGTPDKPVGTVWFGLALGDTVETRLKQFAGDRAQVKLSSAIFALQWLVEYLEAHAPVHRS